MSNLKLLFIHSGEKVKFDTNNRMYTDGSYDENVWNRYRYLSNIISIIMRRDDALYSSNEAQERFNEIPDDICFYEYPDSNRSVYCYFSPSIRRAQRRLLKEHIQAADIVIIRMPGTDYALDEAIRQQKTVLVEVVGCLWDALWNHSIYGKVLAIPAFLRMRRSIWRASFAIYVTDQFLQRRYPTRGKNIGCSDVALLETGENVLARRIAKIENHEGKYIIGTIAAIDVRYKGQAYVIRALGLLKKQGNTDFEYQLVGGGSNQYLRKVAEKENVLDQVRFLGTLPHESVFEWLDSIDIYIQPSKQEGMPRALLEAMSRALPCIGSDAGGMPELLSPDSVCSLGTGFSNRIEEKIFLMNKENMKLEAQCNFEKAKRFRRALLDEKRIAFYRELMEGKLEH